MITLDVLLALACACAPGPAWGSGEWRYVVPQDGEALRTPMESPLLLGNEPPDGLELDVEPEGAAFSFAELRYGDPGSPRIALALDRPKNGGWRLFADANGDRALVPSELVPGAGPAWELELSAWAEDDGQVRRAPRRVSLRVGRTGLLLGAATLGYFEGSVSIEGKHVSARRVDADGNGFFTDARDRLWLDLDGDGKWSSLDEQFLYAPVLRLGAKRYALHSDRLGGDLALEPIVGTGQVRFRLCGADGKPRNDVLALQASLAGRDGSSVGILGHDQPVEAPIGEYRISALTISFASPAGGEPWSFAFSEPGGRKQLPWRRLARGEELVIDPLGKLDFHLELPGEPRAVAGEPLALRFWLATGDGLLVNAGYRGNRSGFLGSSGMRARCALLAADGARLAQADSGFA